jgi:hypothetical protein
LREIIETGILQYVRRVAPEHPGEWRGVFIYF